MHHIKRRIEITTVKEHSVIVRPVSVRAFRWCEACDAEVNMVTPDQAATIAQVFMRTIFQWVESGKLHFAETVDGKLLVCLISLAAHVAAEEALPVEAIDLPEEWPDEVGEDDEAGFSQPTNQQIKCRVCKLD